MNSTIIFGISALTVFLVAFYQLASKEEEKTRFEYTVKNEISVVDFERSMVSFDDFNNFGNPATKGQDAASKDDGWVRKEVYSLAEARKLLFDYFFKNAVVYGRTPIPKEVFSEDWDHMGHVFGTNCDVLNIPAPQAPWPSPVQSVVEP